MYIVWKRSYFACGVPIHVITKHPSINESCGASSAVWVKAIITNSTGSQIPSDSIKAHNHYRIGNCAALTNIIKLCTQISGKNTRALGKKCYYSTLHSIFTLMPCRVTEMGGKTQKAALSRRHRARKMDPLPPHLLLHMTDWDWLIMPSEASTTSP